MRIGDEISFGDYKWCILNIKNNQALIISKYVIEQRAYHDEYKDVTWADCSLRKYLNTEFFSTFSKAEKARIIPVINKNPDNEWYGTSGGADTEDNIFLLSTYEAACCYFGDSSKNLYSSRQNKRYWFERKDPNNIYRIAQLPCENDGVWWWWLRSPGRVGVKAVYIHGDGNIGIQGNNIFKGNVGGPFHNGNSQGGVRPALWIELK